MDLLSSGLKRSYTGPVPHSSEPEMARMRSLSTPSPSHLLHPPMGPNYGTHLEVPESSSGRYIIRRHSTGIVEEGGASPQAPPPAPTPTSLGEPPKFGRFLNVPGTGGGGVGGGGVGGTTEGNNPSTFLKLSGRQSCDDQQY